MEGQKLYLQYLLGIALAILIIPILSIATLLKLDNGLHLLNVIYLTIILFQLIFYYFTTKHNFFWTMLSFIMNYVLWIFEQVLLEKKFGESFIYRPDDLSINFLILGAILWVTNKIIIDSVFDFNKSILKKKCKLETL